jgi:predicted dehydrogenase
MQNINLLFRACAAILILSLSLHLSAQSPAPLRLAVAGLSHGHLAEVTNRVGRGDFVIVGVWEPSDELRNNNPLRKKLDSSLFFKNLDEMLDRAKPEAVVAYGSTFAHLEVVEACAPRNIHVMVEKPLAVNVAHAERMERLARSHNILLLTNYETTWYATNHHAFRLISEGAIGAITRINVYDGHQGPVEIGCGPEFLAWLTDPVLNGGGALFDFGCYGANLATRMMNGQLPTSVFAVLQRQKPAVYPNVDDDATILLQYPSATVQIMASWNWPMGRKDMHAYGSRGYIYQDTPTSMRVFRDRKESTVTPPPLLPPFNDSFLLLKAAARGEVEITKDDLSSLENNVTVVRILEAALKSSRQNSPATP